MKKLELSICIWDYASYNNGVDNWKWFDLGSEVNKLHEHIKNLASQGLEEIFICDYDCNYDINISETNSISKLIKSVEDWDDIEQNALDNLEWYPIEDFDEIMSDNTPWDIATAVKCGDFNPFYHYFGFDAYGNLKSLHKFDLDKEIEDLVISEIENRL